MSCLELVYGLIGELLLLDAIDGAEEFEVLERVELLNSLHHRSELLVRGGNVDNLLVVDVGLSNGETKLFFSLGTVEHGFLRHGRKLIELNDRSTEHIEHERLHIIESTAGSGIIHSGIHLLLLSIDLVLRVVKRLTLHILVLQSCLHISKASVLLAAISVLLKFIQIGKDLF